MSATVPPSLPPDVDRASALYAAFWTPIPILAAVVAARFYVRYNMRNIGLDDWLMLFAYFIFIATNIVGTLYVEAGGSRHVQYITPPSQLTKVMRWSIIAQPFGAVASSVAKTSVAGLTLRIAGPKTFWRRWVLYIGIFILWAFTIADVSLKFAQCNPVRANWDVEILPTDKHCWNPSISAKMSIANASFGAAMDFILALIPCTMIWNLQIEWKTKLSLMVLLSLGIFAGIASAVKTDQLNLLTSRADFTWGVYDMFIWTEVELSMVIFCGCIPPMKPLYDWMLKGKPISPAGSTSSRSSKSFRSSTRFSSKTATHKSATSSTSETSLTKSRLSEMQEDENALWERPKDAIYVSRKWEVDSQSVPSST